jgi:hypothetical protein
MMELDAHGTYIFKKTDHILYVNAQGPFNEIIVQQYAHDIDEFSCKFNNKKWVSLTSFYGDSIFTPEAEKYLIAILQGSSDNGLLAHASIILESCCRDLQYMQLTRIHQKSNIAFNIFSDVSSAEKWLEGYTCNSTIQRAQ